MIQTLELQQFRSYSDGLYEFSDGVNIIVGPNASGKTNLLEGLHTICTQHGFRSSDLQLIQFDKDWAKLTALTDNGQRIFKFREDKKHTAIVDDVERAKLRPQDNIPVVVFEPQHMLLLTREPELRRSYIDGILSATESGYASRLKSYKRTLSQRNRLLKQDGVSASQLFAWNVKLSQLGGVIADARDALVSRIAPRVERHYQSISSGEHKLKISYESKLNTANYESGMLAWFDENVALDRARGYSGVGPHRDDLAISLDGRDARTSASRGETRSIVLALKMVELEEIEQATGKKALFLLDDVFSELDGSRRRALAELLNSRQSFITTTDADVVMDHFSDYRIIPIGSE